jgi:peptidyl-prolyl cis-trans isomerase B (cyclophilin B)
VRSALEDPERNIRAAAIHILRSSGAPDVPEDPGPADTDATDITYDILASLRLDRSVAIIETDRGSIEIELYRQDAPLTVARFAALARSGGFDGRTFSRVVPFFAVETANPYGSDSGCCEVNLRPFERGSLVMMCSGKDSGMNQIIITLVPQPDPAGGNICIGHVVSGMQVADRIAPGDRLIRVRIKEDKTVFDEWRF